MADMLDNMLIRSRRIIRLVLSSHHSPKEIAGGAALGTFIGFAPLMGFQMVIAAVLSTFFRLSRVAAMGMVYVSNPITAVPIYVSCYYLGVWLLSPFGFRVLSRARIEEIFAWPEDVGRWDSIWLKVGDIFNLGWEGLAPLWLGCVVCGSVSAVIAYYVALRFVTGHRLLKAQRMAKRAQKRIERIRQEQEIERGHHPEGTRNDAPAAQEQC